MTTGERLPFYVHVQGLEKDVLLSRLLKLIIFSCYQRDPDDGDRDVPRNISRFLAQLLC
jgi:hypothetical protein